MIAMAEQLLIPDMKLTGTTITSHRNSLRTTLRHAVELTDWDAEVTRREHWVNACCWAVLAVACMGILPFLIGLFQS